MPPKRKKENIEVNLQRGTMSGTDVHNHAVAHFQPEHDWVDWGDRWISTSAALTKEINKKRKTWAPPRPEEVALWRESADALLGAYPHETDDMYEMYRAMSGGPRVNPARRAMMTQRQEELRDLRERLEKDKEKLAGQRKARKTQRKRTSASSLPQPRGSRAGASRCACTASQLTRTPRPRGRAEGWRSPWV